jgi:hypothetical protein
MGKNKGKIPAEVKTARKRRERKRIWIGAGFMALWWTLFILGLATGLDWFLWAGWLAISGELVVLYGLHEKALRKIAGRPAVDYGQLRKLEKAEIRSRPEGESPAPLERS